MVRRRSHHGDQKQTRRDRAKANRHEWSRQQEFRGPVLDEQPGLSVEMMHEFIELGSKLAEERDKGI